MMNFPDISHKMLLHWNIAGAEDCPYGIRQYSKWSEVVLKVVLHLFPSQICTKFHSFMKILPFCTCSKATLVVGDSDI